VIGWKIRRRTISKPSSASAGRQGDSTRPKMFFSLVAPHVLPLHQFPHPRREWFATTSVRGAALARLSQRLGKAKIGIKRALPDPDR